MTDIKLTTLYSELKIQRDDAEQHRLLCVLHHDDASSKYWSSIVNSLNNDMRTVLVNITK